MTDTLDAPIFLYLSDVYNNCMNFKDIFIVWFAKGIISSPANYLLYNPIEKMAVITYYS